MFQSQKHVFWQALLATVLIFSLGILVGVLLENWRTIKINSLYQSSEIDLLDIKLQNQIYSELDFNCELAIQENLNFADRIYEESEILERYEKASRLTEDMITQHKKYDILRLILLLNSIKIKEKCNTSYHEVVYFYDYNDAKLDIKAKQNVFSKLLSELKQEKGNEVLLIPMAGDNDILSIDLILKKYNISNDELPVILIDREIKITDIQNIEALLEYFE